MGQQHYESQITQALQSRPHTDWALSSRRIVSWHSQIEGSVRLPTRPLWNAPFALVAPLAQRAYGRADLIHRLDLRLPPRLGREIITIHDLPPLRFPDEGNLPRWAAKGARRSAGVICPSEFAADEVSSLLKIRRVWVIPYGVASAFLEPNPMGDQELKELRVSRPFVLHAAGATQRKNLSSLATAWKEVASSAPEATLVMCGPLDSRRDRLFASLPRVRLLGQLELQAVARLMQAATLVVVPSLYEGFGLPALEGMAAGVPVVAANCAALPEVCGSAALLVPPTPAGLADGIMEVLEQREVETRLRHDGKSRAALFTWERAASATIAAYREAMG